ncbi:MAG: hypothetical protein ABSF13_11425 [Smithella sp.]|jgi:hypothetical protein
MIDQSELKAFKDALALRGMSFMIFSTDRKPEEGICAKKVHCVMSLLRRAPNDGHVTLFQIVILNFYNCHPLNISR